MDRARVAVIVAGVVTAAASVAAIVAAATSSDTDAGGGGGGAGGGTTVTTTAPTGGSLAIEIRDFTFGPEAPTIAPGTQAVWTNADGVAHSIRSADGSFDSPDLDQGQTFTFVFNEPGTYEYVCGIHDSMRGTIIVEG